MLFWNKLTEYKEIPEKIPEFGIKVPKFRNFQNGSGLQSLATPRCVAENFAKLGPT